jgi:CheY-like chemotaxis protein
VVQALLPELQGLRNLLVDDDPGILELLYEQLTTYGMVVETATLPHAAMATLQVEAGGGRPPFDLLLLDLVMPKQDGIAMARAIRNDRHLANLPIIIMTGRGKGMEEERARAVGVNAFLFKPFTPGVLVETIVAVVAKSRPLPCAPKLAAPTAPYAPKSFRGCKVLLVEDNRFNQLLAVELLEIRGLTVEVANNGKEAVAMAGPQFDALLMDIQMPEMDGFEATGLIRQQEGCAGIPIIAMTAHAMDGYREKCLAGGMDDYVTKPFEPEELFAVLSRFIGTDEEVTVAEDPSSSSMASGGADDAAIALQVQVKAHLRNAYQLEAEMAGKMVRQATESLAEQLVVGDAALAGGDMDTFRRAAHTIKGMLRSLGLSQWGDLAERVEKFQPGPGEEPTTALLSHWQGLRTELAPLLRI